MEFIPDPGGAVPEVPGYDVGRLLGRGGTAAVWLVTEHSTGREFALKCLDPGGVAGRDGEREVGAREAEDAIRREVRILSALDHDHLVRAHDVLRLRIPQSGPNEPAGPEEREALGLVLDYAPGGSAADLVAGRSRLSAGETVTILTPIAQALEYLHSQGFTHGDVSPGNVLFTAHGKPLLADVGVARMVADAGGDRLAGTEGFSDPAPVDAVRAGLQPERDVYSLAALGWYCLTGRPPVPGARRPPLPLLVPDVPAALAAALEAGLAEDRRQRPSAAELAAAVYRSTAAEPVDLSVTAHPTVVPQLLTRRAVPRNARERLAARRRGWLRQWFRWAVAGRTPQAGRDENSAIGDSSRPGPGALSNAGSRTDDDASLTEAGRTAGTGPRHSAAGSEPDVLREVALETRRVGAHSAADDAGGDARRDTFGTTLGTTRRTAGDDTVNEARSATRPHNRQVASQGNRDSARRPRRRKLWVGTAAAVALLAGVCVYWLHSVGAIPEMFAGSAPLATSPGAGGGAGTDGSSSGQWTAGTAAPRDSVIPLELRNRLESADPGEAVRGLAALRSLAFNSGDFSLLDAVNAPESAAAAADVQIRTQLSGSGHVLAGFSTSLTRIETTADSSAARAVVALTMASSAYQELDGEGNVVGEVPAAAAQQLQLVLVPVDGRWRIQDVLPPGPEAG